MKRNPREETLRAVEENIKERVRAGATLLNEPEPGCEYRNIPDYLIGRLLSAIPEEREALRRELKEYGELVRNVAPFMVKACYTSDTPLQIQRMHIIEIMQANDVPILKPRPWTIECPWKKKVVKLFHNH